MDFFFSNVSLYTYSCANNQFCLWLKEVRDFFKVAKNYMMNNIIAALSLSRGFASVCKD